MLFRNCFISWNSYFIISQNKIGADMNVRMSECPNGQKRCQNSTRALSKAFSKELWQIVKCWKYKKIEISFDNLSSIWTNGRNSFWVVQVQFLIHPWLLFPSQQWAFKKKSWKNIRTFGYVKMGRDSSPNLCLHIFNYKLKI